MEEKEKTEITEEQLVKIIDKLIEDKQPKRWTFEWFKEEALRSIMGLVFTGLALVVGWSIIQAFVGEIKWEAKFETFKLEVHTTMLEKTNETVKREAELMKLIKQQSEEFEAYKKQREPTGSGAPIPIPLPPSLPPLPIIPSLTPRQSERHAIPNASQHPDTAKLEWIEKYEQQRNSTLKK